MNSHSDSEIKSNKEDPSKKYLKTKKRFIKRNYKNDEVPERLKEILKNRPRTAKQEQLMSCAMYNDLDRARDLLGNGVNPNSSDIQLRTPLHVAAAKGFKDMVHLLLQFGADPNSHDIVLNTPLHLAACTSNLPVVVLLINYGADITLLDLHGRNPLQLALGKLEILRKSWREGAIEMFKLRSQLEEIIEVMISLRKRQDTSNVQTDRNANIDALQLMKLSINTGPEEDMDCQMSLLESQLQQFKLK